jgi:hypothetical protein
MPKPKPRGEVPAARTLDAFRKRIAEVLWAQCSVKFSGVATPLATATNISRRKLGSSMASVTTSVTSAPTPPRRNLLPYRLATQMVFVLIHVLLIRAAIPNLAWAIYGILFWAALVYLTMRTGRWVCAWICWLGGAQDLFARFARARVAFNPRWTQIGVLVVAALWVPLAWLFWRDAMTAHTSSMGFDAENWWSHALHLGLLAFVVGSVFVLGKRGACRYFCPFGMVVDGCRKMHQASSQPGLVTLKRRRVSPTTPAAEAAANATTNRGETA